MPDNATRSMETETHILAATVKLVMEKGFDHTTIREICALAGVSTGAFYHHFPSKVSLFERSFLLYDATLAERFQLEDGDPVETLRALLLQQTDFTVGNTLAIVRGYYRYILMDENNQASNPQRLYYRAVRRQTERACALGRFSPGRTPEQVAELLIKFTRGCIVDWCLHGGSYDVVERLGDELDVVLVGLGAKRD